MKYITKDNITFLIAVIGFALSLWNFFKDLWNHRSKIRLRYKSCAIGKTARRNIMYFELSFENFSRLPISISRIFFKNNNNIFEFEWIPEKITTTTYKTGNTVTDQKSYFSEKIPHSIDGLGLWGGFFFLSTPFEFKKSDLLDNKSKIILYTNRGKKELNLPITAESIKN